LYFGWKVGDQDKKWAPHMCCTTCSSKVSAWVNCKGRSLPFAGPMIWREPTNHTTECYSCMVPPIKKVWLKKKWTVSYPNIPSAIRLVPHGERLPIPKPPEKIFLETVLEMMRMINISFIYTVKNSNHQLQEFQNFVQALIRPSHIISQKLSLMTSWKISNCRRIRLSFWHHVHFIVAGDINLPWKFVQHSVFLYSWQWHVYQHKECIVASTAAIISERTTILRYMYAVCLVKHFIHNFRIKRRNHQSKPVPSI
jgi:hypothetical protein